MKRVALGTAVLTVALTVAGPAVPASAASASKASTASDVEPVAFTWNRTLTAGHCRIRPGAKWTLYPNGTARFEARVSSTTGDDAWLMWAYLMDGEDAVLGEIRVAGSSSTKFVKNLPYADGNYRWQADGQFDPRLFDQVEAIVLTKHC